MLLSTELEQMVADQRGLKFVSWCLKDERLARCHPAGGPAECRRAWLRCQPQIRSLGLGAPTAGLEYLRSLVEMNLKLAD